MHYVFRFVAFILLSVGALAKDAAVVALASLTDPQKLATLKDERAANDRLLKCVYWLNHSRDEGKEASAIINEAQALTGHTAAHALVVKQGLLGNLGIAGKLGCLTPENLEKMRRGYSPVVTKGPFRGEKAEVDHIIPLSIHPELGNEIANLWCRAR